MRVRRLGWAGLELEAGSGVAVVDLLEDLSGMAPFVGAPHEALPPARAGAAALALVTHLHADHTDPAAIGRALAPGGVLLRPAPARGSGLETAALAAAEQGLAKADFEIRTVADWETVRVGPFAATAVPAVDGFGDPQVSWVVEAGGVRVFHGGDTLFHGAWWLIASRLGPIDAAFLPCNAAVCDFPHRQPASPLPATLDPRQAATAARLLRAQVAVPIHYGAIHAPPVYAQVDDPAAAFEAAARAADVPVRVMGVGDELDLVGAAAAA